MRQVIFGQDASLLVLVGVEQVHLFYYVAIGVKIALNSKLKIPTVNFSHGQRNKNQI